MNISVPDEDELSSAPVEREVHRQLIEQFYESSIERYGIDSEQTRMFALHLSAYTGQD